MNAELATWQWYQSIGVDALISEQLLQLSLVSATHNESETSPNAPFFPATTLAELCQRMEAIDSPSLRGEASQFVFADGNPNATIMLIGEAPGVEEERQGKPFVGASGHLLDKMLSSLGWSRADVYITNVIPWRPLQNRTPTPQEIALFQPYLAQHIALVKPKVIGFLGGIAAKALLDTSTGILRLRGQWHEYEGIPCLPMLHPAFLLRSPEQKRLAWRDWLQLKAKVESLHANMAL